MRECPLITLLNQNKMNDIATIIAMEVERKLESKFNVLLLEIQKLKTQANVPEKKYLNRRETAALIGISLPTLSSYVIRDVLKAYRISNKVLFLKNEVESSLKLIKSIKHRKEEYCK